jgi:hypothetical protein
MIIKIDLASNESVISADLSGRDNIVLSTTGKNIYICDWKGNIIRSITSLTDEINLIKKIECKNSLLTMDKNGIQMCDNTGSILKSLRINGIYDAECDYDTINKRLILRMTEIIRRYYKYGDNQFSK